MSNQESSCVSTSAECENKSEMELENIPNTVSGALGISSEIDTPKKVDTSSTKVEMEKMASCPTSEELDSDLPIQLEPDVSIKTEVEASKSSGTNENTIDDDKKIVDSATEDLQIKSENIESGISNIDLEKKANEKDSVVDKDNLDNKNSDESKDTSEEVPKKSKNQMKKEKRRAQWRLYRQQVKEAIERGEVSNNFLCCFKLIFLVYKNLEKMSK